MTCLCNARTLLLKESASGFDSRRLQGILILKDYSIDVTEINHQPTSYGVGDVKAL